MAFLLWRAEETEVTLDLKTSLNLEHSWQMTTYTVLTAASIVLLTLFLDILNYTESLSSKVRNSFECKANTNI